MTLLLWIACSAPETDSGIVISESTAEDSAEACEMPLHVTIEGDDIVNFGEAPSYSNPLYASVYVENACATDLIFMGEPSGWSTHSALSLEAPPPLRLRAGEGVELNLVLYPEAPGEMEGNLNIATDQGPPTVISWKASIGPAIPILMLSQDRHVALSMDYGQSIATWNLLPGPNTDRVRGLCYGNGRAIAVGGESSQVIWSSFDGNAWTRDENNGLPLNDCASNGNRFAAAEVDPHWSLAGLEWEEGEGTPWMHDPLTAITVYQNRFIAIGGQGRVAMTEDGESWLFDESIGTFNLFSMAKSPERLIATGQFGFIGWTEDGINWSTQMVGNGILQAAAYGDGVFLTSDGATLFRSENAETWEMVGESPIKPFASTGKRFIGFGNGFLHMTEDRGETWHQLAPLPFGSPIIDTVFMP